MIKKELIFVVVLIILAGCQNTITEIAPEPEVYFNPGLSNKLSIILEEAEEKIDCALYDLNIKELINILDEKNKQIEVRLVMDDEQAIKRDYVRVDEKGLMHNKFCIIDDVLTWTGSYNPTGENNDENMIILFSKSISNVYEKEFQEMWKGTYKKGKKSKNNIIKLNKATYKIYFCPEDNCEEKVLKELDKAEKSIQFMVFSFTSQKIADKLVEKRLIGIDIKGVWEERRINMDYEKYNYLTNNRIEIKPDDNKYVMHHKVFIIDNETIITGSYNPTNNGNKNNDENILITDDIVVVNKYLQEFERLYRNN